MLYRLRLEQRAYPLGTQKEVLNVLMELPERTNAIWRILGGIVHRPWSRRLWVLQEIVLAEDDTVLCDLMEVSWDHLVRFVRAMMRHGIMRHLRGVEDDEYPQNYTSGIEECHSLRHFRTRNYGYEIPVEILLQKGRNREVTDPIDKIYGILALMPEHIQEKMTVDYTLPPTQVYVLFSRLWLQTDSMLSMLSLVDGPNQAEGLPSWCPNYNSPRVTAELGGQMGLLSGYHAGFWSPWRPRKVMRIEPQTNVMRIKALKVDNVPHIVKPKLRISFYGRTNAANTLS